jgi:hypothetical protein
MTSWFEPQNQTDYGLSVALQNRREGDGVGRALRSSSLFRVEASRARVFQSGLKIGGGTTAIGAHGTMVKVMSRSNQRRTDRCYGLHQILLPLICHFLCISPLGAVQFFSILLEPINRTLEGWSSLSLLHFI